MRGSEDLKRSLSLAICFNIFDIFQHHVRTRGWQEEAPEGPQEAEPGPRRGGHGLQAEAEVSHMDDTALNGH